MKTLAGLVTVGALFLFSGCGDNQDRNSKEQVRKDHVWKDQVEMLDKAKELEDMALDSAEKRRKQIEDQGG